MALIDGSKKSKRFVFHSIHFFYYFVEFHWIDIFDQKKKKKKLKTTIKNFKHCKHPFDFFISAYCIFFYFHLALHEINSTLRVFQKY